MKLVVLGAAVGTMLWALFRRPRELLSMIATMSWFIRHYDRGHHYGWYKHRAECRTVRVRTKLPNGNVIIKTRRSC